MTPSTASRLPLRAAVKPALVGLALPLLLAACAAPIGTASGNTPAGPGLDAPAPTPLDGDEAAASWMHDILRGDPPTAAAALQAILEAGDIRFVAVLIELLRAREIGVYHQLERAELAAALGWLSGEGFGANWAAWVEWYGATELTPPPGFLAWKGRLMARIDPRFAEFLREGLPTAIRVEEIVWGGVKVDGIPALDQATMIPAAEARYLFPDEPVFGLSVNGDARAYPLRILDWHEMANDVVGGVPVSLAYCTLCGAGIAFDGRAADGTTLDFGSSGFLVRSNKLMYDRQTRTLWNQLTGEPVLGELAGGELRLERLPVVLTTWQAWLEQHPDTRVLALETGYERLYLPGAAYGDYFAGGVTMFPVWQRADDLATQDRIYALYLDGIAKAYPLDLLDEEVVVNDAVGDRGVVLVAARGTVSVLGANLRVGPVTYEAGGEVRAFDRGDRTFSAGPAPDVLLDQDGRRWTVTEDGLLGPGDEVAPRLPGHLAYWFGWYAFFPDTLLYDGS